MLFAADIRKIEYLIYYIPYWVWDGNADLLTLVREHNKLYFPFRKKFSSKSKRRQKAKNQKERLIDLKNLLMNEATMCTLKTLVILQYTCTLFTNPTIHLSSLGRVPGVSAGSSIIILIYTLYISSLYKFILKRYISFKLTTLILKQWKYCWS